MSDAKKLPCLLISVAISLLFAASVIAKEQPEVRVACLGDSITAGARVDAKTESYPARLQTAAQRGKEIFEFLQNALCSTAPVQLLGR